MTVDMEKPAACPACGCEQLTQDEDVLDTWFSSALWPFSTLGWPEETEELKYFYPTDVLVTGYDIIFFWVVRMAFSGMEVMGETPFKYVYVHGLVRDAEGRKMSKSLGNGIDPLEIIEKYGADALRFMLIAGTSTGNDMRFQIEKLEGARNFANKLWNASRFVIMNLKGEDGTPLDIAAFSLSDWGSASTLLKDEDHWMLSGLEKAVVEVTRHLERFDLSLAAQRINSLIWDEFCDWYIELVKSRLYHDNESEKAIVRAVLLKTLKDLLKLLHPFMPFITEEIWSYLPKTGGEPDLLILAAWPSEAQSHAVDVEYSIGRIYTEPTADTEPTISKAPTADIEPIIGTEPSADIEPTISTEPSADIEPTIGTEPLLTKEATVAKKQLRSNAVNRIEIAMEIIKSIRNIRADAGAVSSKKLNAYILAGSEVQADLKMIETHIISLGGLSHLTFIDDRNLVPGESAAAITADVEVLIPLDDLLDYKAEYERLLKEKKRIESEITKIGVKLENQGFISKAPPEIIKTEKDRMNEYESMLVKINTRLEVVVGKSIP